MASQTMGNNWSRDLGAGDTKRESEEVQWSYDTALSIAIICLIRSFPNQGIIPWCQRYYDVP